MNTEQAFADTLWLMTPNAVGEPVRDLADALDVILRRPAWQRRAACRGEDVSTFIGEQGTTYRRAKELCAGCPVRIECLAFALADPEIVGYWAGTTTRERARMRRQVA